MKTERNEDPALERALDALEQGDPEEALAQLEQVDRECGERWTVTAHAFLELGNPTGVERALDRARGLLGREHPDVMWTEGVLALGQWDLTRAAERLELLDEEHFGPALLENLALLADLAGDTRGADELLERAADLDPDGPPAPVHLSSAAFEEVVARAARDLPPEFQTALEEVAVVIDPMPTAAVVGAPSSGHPPDLLGLFVGPPLAERAQADPNEPPPTIFLFQRNLERSARDREHLLEEIRVTLYHELGHALGFDEDGVDALGLG